MPLFHDCCTQTRDFKIDMKERIKGTLKNIPFEYKAQCDTTATKMSVVFCEEIYE